MKFGLIAAGRIFYDETGLFQNITYHRLGESQFSDIFKSPFSVIDASHYFRKFDIGN
ncbi:MAG TPA: hypothetical protein VIQ51_06360 [Chryseosolibacter sp.]|jgi:hypothetical protein